MSVAEKLGYLRGLADGLHLDGASGSKAERLIAALIDAVEELAEQVSEGEEQCKELAAQIDDLAESLEVVETLVLDGIEEDEDFDEYEVECPNCAETLVIDADALESGVITCPACEKKFEIDLGFADDPNDCDENDIR